MFIQTVSSTMELPSSLCRLLQKQWNFHRIHTKKLRQLIEMRDVVFLVNIKVNKQYEWHKQPCSKIR